MVVVGGVIVVGVIVVVGGGSSVLSRISGPATSGLPGQSRRMLPPVQRMNWLSSGPAYSRSAMQPPTLAVSVPANCPLSGVPVNVPFTSPVTPVPVLYRPYTVNRGVVPVPPATGVKNRLMSPGVLGGASNAT